MLHSFKDAMDVVDEYNEWANGAFDQQVPTPHRRFPSSPLCSTKAVSVKG